MANSPSSKISQPFVDPAKTSPPPLPQSQPVKKSSGNPKPNGRQADPSGKKAMASKSRKGQEKPADESDVNGEPVQDGGNRFLLFTAAPSWLTSMLVHIVLLLILAILTLPTQAKVYLSELVIGEEDSEQIDEFEGEDFEPMDMEISTEEFTSDLDSGATMSEVVTVETAAQVATAPLMAELVDIGAQVAPTDTLLSLTGGGIGSGLDGRKGQNRGKLARERGASKGSEAAVAKALKWLYNHQLPDGSWSFDHRVGVCQGRCLNHGSPAMAKARIGATAMALLPFLGAGHTHKEGKYKGTVHKGLYFLTRSMRVETQRGMQVGNLWEEAGQMYSHGLASIALCEAYGMTKDPELMQPAQFSLNYIAFAQDSVGGGWRYSAGQPGDTSVVGWQLMALKSGHMAYLQVDPRTVQGAVKFLDFVQTDSGSRYGYSTPGAGDATSAIGLLCRMYLGWRKDHGALQRGIVLLSNAGPSSTNMYYNYYATQVMCHSGGELWKAWNVKMRDSLVNSQATAGHAEGSWFINGGHGGAAGRLYSTSMATMILEVYYRHMPIYGKQSTQDDFEL